MNNIMIDIETMGTSPGCAILSIGACRFGLDDVAPRDNHFYAVVKLGEGNEKIEPSTALWWMAQSDEARLPIASQSNAISIVDALTEFSSWVGLDEIKIWCHGAGFDAPILADAYQRHGIKVPWGFRDVRDTRTLYDLAMVEVDRSSGTYHNALDDAVAQAEAAIKAFRVLEKNT